MIKIKVIDLMNFITFIFMIFKMKSFLFQSMI